MNTCQIDLGVFVLPFISFCQIINENHSSKRGLDQELFHKKDNKEHRSYEGRGVGERKGTGPTLCGWGLWYFLLLPPTSAVLACDFKYLAYSLKTTRPFATFLPSAEMSIYTSLRFKDICNKN